MNDLSRNETILFITKQEFPKYFLLKMARSKNRDAHRLDGDEQDLIKSIAAYIRKLRCLSLAEITELQTEANKKYCVRIAANKSRRLEASKQKDEELFFNYPSQQADFEFWAKMDYWTEDEAVALSFGRNPKTINWDVVFQYTGISPFAKEYEKRRILAQRACKCGAIINPISPIKFLCWASKVKIICPEELVSLVQIYGSSECMQVVPEEIEWEAPASDSQAVQKVAENLINPLPISGIAKIFKIDLDEKNNTDKWNVHARQAQRNGLADARVTNGKGRSKSTFDPIRIGEWLVKQGKMSQAEIDRRLAKNLPERSKHLKGYFAQ